MERPRDELHRVLESLHAQGVALGDLDSVDHSFSPTITTTTNPTIVDRVRDHTGHLIGELSETREVLVIASRSLLRGQRMTAEDRDALVCQLLDLLRILPAAMIAGANWILPVPGTSMATPFLLAKMGLLPSRWREARILQTLRKEHHRLTELGLTEEAATVDALRQLLANEADERARIWSTATLLCSWDADGNGVIDDEERAAYEAAIDRLATLALTNGHKRRWFLFVDNEVVGPVRLGPFLEAGMAPTALVCFDGKGGWVELERVVTEATCGSD